jgi:hypothetical protein
MCFRLNLLSISLPLKSFIIWSNPPYSPNSLTKSDMHLRFEKKLGRVRAHYFLDFELDIVSDSSVTEPSYIIVLLPATE